MVPLSVDDLLVTGTDSVAIQIFRTALNDALVIAVYVYNNLVSCVNFSLV